MRRTVDLRSDTTTRPTAAMFEAMARATVGDDAFGEDPTVRRLQQKAPGMLGKEAALYVPSGTMGNACAPMAHADEGAAVFFRGAGPPLLPAPTSMPTEPEETHERTRRRRIVVRYPGVAWRPWRFWPERSPGLTHSPSLVSLRMELDLRELRP